MISGTPADTPVEPVVPEGKLALNSLFVPAYTRKTSDIVMSRKDVERFTMQDIKKIVRRVERIEEFATLTADEQSVINFEVRDAATGLTRFKTGYIVERFVNPLVIADTTNAEFRAGLDRNQLSAPLEVQSCNLIMLSNSSHYTMRNAFVTLPYTQTPFAQQNLSSRVTNLNPFLTIKWEGLLSVFPSTDNWVEIQNASGIFRNIVENVVITRWQLPNGTVTATRVNAPVTVSNTAWVTPAPAPIPAALPPSPPPIVRSI